MTGPVSVYDADSVERMRDVLLALADACDVSPPSPIIGRSRYVIGALDRVLVEMDALPHGERTWRDTAAALRAVAGGAS